jgi:hypothetical protein
MNHRSPHVARRGGRAGCRRACAVRQIAAARPACHAAPVAAGAGRRRRSWVVRLGGVFCRVPRIRDPTRGDRRETVKKARTRVPYSISNTRPGRVENGTERRRKDRYASRHALARARARHASTLKRVKVGGGSRIRSLSHASRDARADLILDPCRSPHGDRLTNPRTAPHAHGPCACGGLRPSISV